MADRHTADTITDDELDQLYERIRLLDGMRQNNLDAACAAVERAEQAEAALARLTRALPAVRRALDSLPARCRYHGEDTDPRRPSYGHEACCDTGIPAQRRRLAEQALTQLETTS
jgi:hypothetical protein